MGADHFSHSQGQHIIREESDHHRPEKLARMNVANGLEQERPAKGAHHIADGVNQKSECDPDGFGMNQCLPQIAEGDPPKRKVKTDRSEEIAQPYDVLLPHKPRYCTCGATGQSRTVQRNKFGAFVMDWEAEPSIRNLSIQRLQSFRQVLY